MPPVIPFLTGIGATAGAATLPSMLAAGAPAIGAAAGLGSIYNSMVSQPQQAQSALDTQKQALSKSNMSEFLRNQILRQQAGQMQNMAQNYGQPDFLKAFLEKQNQNNFYQGGGY